MRLRWWVMFGRGAGVLAWGIVAVLSCRGLDGPRGFVALADSADQIVYGLVHNVTTDGVLRARIEADTAFFYESTQSVELKQLTAVFFSALGEVSSTITAAEGTYKWQIGDMEARINVVAVTPDGRRLTTAILSYNKISNRLTGPERFEFDAPDRRLTGDGFTADPDFRDIRATGISGRVKNP
ncbi:MAG: LPS export ABC transporter periplasmic protein LptC [Gemmatimonadetes bacterium]|nr:LPS export ABC transporter periplasmic protein LptC [Gemmatimonadota bacterium]